MLAAWERLKIKSMPFQKLQRLTRTVIIIILLFTLTGYIQHSWSISSLEQAQQDYSFQTTKYQDAKEKYETAKSNHKVYNTAVSKNEAFLKTQEYLIQANNVYITYLLLINERSNLYDWGKGIYPKNEQHQIIQDQIKALEDLKTEAQNLKTLEETTPYAQKMKDHVEKNTLPTAYFLLVKTDLSQLLEVQYDFNETAAVVSAYVQGRIKEADKQLFLNWQSQIQTVLEQSKIQTDQKKAEIEKIPPNIIIKNNQESFAFTSENERDHFRQSPDLLYEILNFI